MKGIVLAGGLGTRLDPITRVVNKHVLPVGSKPMFFHPFQTLVASGIREIAVVSGPPYGAQVKELIKYLSLPLQIRVAFVKQTSPKGMPDAILKCKKFVGDDSVIVIAGDNIFGGNFKKEVGAFKKGAVSFLRKVNDPSRHGVPSYDGAGKLQGIIEKPKNPATNWVVCGPHIFDKMVFNHINKLKPSARGELEIAELNGLYIKLGLLKLVKKTDYWLDLGTFDSLVKGNQYAERNKK